MCLWIDVDDPTSNTLKASALDVDAVLVNKGGGPAAGAAASWGDPREDGEVPMPAVRRAQEVLAELASALRETDGGADMTTLTSSLARSQIEA